MVFCCCLGFLHAVHQQFRFNSVDQIVLEISPKRKRGCHGIFADKPPVLGMSCDWSLQIVLAIGARVERNGLGFGIEICGFEPNLSIWLFIFHAEKEMLGPVRFRCGYWKGSHFVFGSVFSQGVVPSAGILIVGFIGVIGNFNGTQFLERDGGLH